MKLNSTFKCIAGIFLLCLSTLITSGQEEKSWNADIKIVERLSKDGPLFNYYENKVPSFTLPEALVSQKGIKIVTPDLWNTVRRPEILELFRKNVFGRVPDSKYTESFKLLSIDQNALDGKATKKEVEIRIESDGKSLTFNLIIFSPNNIKQPVPAFLLIDPWFSDGKTPRWNQDNGYWPIKEAIARGYGMAIYDAALLDPDNFDNFKNGIHPLLDKGSRPDDAWGTLAAWAWGASRCLDFLITDKSIAHDKIAVVGHSRAGKTALWAGASDTRFALVISNESGAGGAALARRRYGETVARLNSVFPHWFCSNYNKYSNNEDAMPVDMHMLLALVAPRAVYVDCADEDLWCDPHGSYLSLYNAVPVFKLFGKASALPESMPPLNKPVISGNLGFHIRDGAHNLTLKDWNWFMDFADKILK